MASGLQALADAFSDAPAPNLADTTSGSGLSALAAAFASDQPQQGDAPAGWTRKGILLINNQTGQAIEGIMIIMAAYLTVSLSISLFMNWYNKRIALVER